MTTTDPKQVTVEWWINDVLDGLPFERGTDASQDNCCNLLAGFLQACERFELMTHDEAQELFSELVG